MDKEERYKELLEQCNERIRKEMYLIEKIIVGAATIILAVFILKLSGML